MQLGNVIAIRHLIVRTPKGDVPVTVQIGTPQPSNDGKDWRCPYRVGRANARGIRYASGVDADVGVGDVNGGSGTVPAQSE